MKLLVVCYLLLFAAACTALGFWIQTDATVHFPTALILPASCALIGGIGGAAYCLRGVYLTACVKQQWNDVWLPWYYIRPWVSLICGGVSFLFLKAGLLLLESTQMSEASDLGFYALSFIAGLNVDNFLSKIEDIAQAAWGIKKSRTGQKDGEQ